MTCIVNLTITIDPAKRTEFLTEFSAVLPVTRAYSGCHGLYLCENDDSGQIEAVSIWESRAHYETYLQWRTDSGVLATFAEKYFTADPTWRFMPELMTF